MTHPTNKDTQVKPLCYCCKHGNTMDKFTHCKCPDLYDDITKYDPKAIIPPSLNNQYSVSYALPVLTVISGACPHFMERKETPRQEKQTA